MTYHIYLTTRDAYNWMITRKLGIQKRLEYVLKWANYCGLNGQHHRTYLYDHINNIQNNHSTWSENHEKTATTLIWAC